MNYPRIYRYRFKGIDQKTREEVWKEIARYLESRMGHPRRLLDPGAGRCEFINASSAPEKWAVEQNPEAASFCGPKVRCIVGDVLKTDLPPSYFDGIFVSNLLEHLHSQEEVAEFLGKMHLALQSGGRILVMGPNFKLCYKDYFDFADHRVALTELGAAEHLYGAGFEIVRKIKGFLPLSFRESPYPSPFLARLYLHLPMAWRIFGRQFLILARKP